MGRIGRYWLYVAAAAGLLLTPLLGGTASADAICSTCIAFDMNYGTNTISSVGQLNFNDPSIIEQNFSNGDFVEEGVIQFTSYQTVDSSGVISGTVHALPGVTLGTTDLYVIYTLTGTFNGTSVTFNPGGTLTWYYGPTYTTDDSNGNDFSTPGAGATTLATLGLVYGNAPATGDEASGLTLTGEELITQQTGGNANLFTDTAGNDLFDSITNMALIDEISQGNASTGSFSPCSSSVLSDLGDISTGSGTTACTTGSTKGSLQLGGVPEPASLILFGSALMSLAGLKRWCRKGAKGSEAA
jgi:hypothetical protein